MDIKRLHEAIKELRAELDRVNLAIHQIERIAADNGEGQTSDESPQPPPAENSSERS